MSIKLQTPTIIAFTPFDPNYEYDISFTYTGTPITKSRARIVDINGVVVYDETQTISNRLIHTIIPSQPQILEAGESVRYTIQIQVFDKDDNYSDFSDPVLFYCFSTPEFYFEELSNNDVIDKSSITLKLKYVQAENEPIRSIQFLKYSLDKTLLDSSDVIYSPPSISTLYETFYTFNSLDNGIYYFRAIGETKYGTPLDTGYIQINVKYNENPLLVSFNLENHYCDGYISIDTNIMDINYK